MGAGNGALVMRFVLFFLVMVMPLIASAETITTRDMLCKSYEERADVAGANYVPGVDVDGKPVVSADVSGDHQVMPLQVVRIPLEMDLAQRFGLSLPEGLEMKPNLGMLNIYQDGRVTFDGQDLTTQVEQFCSQAREAETQKVEEEPAANGQAAPDRIISNSDTNVDMNDLPSGSVIEGQAN